LTILSVGLFMVAALIAALAFRTRDFNWPPNPQGLYQGYLHRDPRMAKQSTCLAIIFAYNRNGSIIQEKNRSFNIAFTFASVAVFVLGIALMAHIALQTMPPGVPLPAPTTTAAPATNPTGGTGGSGTTP